MSYKKGDIVVVKFPFIIKEDTERRKGRPALVIFDDKVERRYKDVILAAITSQIPAKIMELELILEPIESTGLAKKSLLRVQERITCCFIALSFRSDLVDLTDQDRRCSLSYSEDAASEERPKVTWK